MRRTPLLVTSFFFLLAVSPPAVAQEAPDPEPPLSYGPMIDGAVAEFAAGRWAEARALFRRAHELYPNARTLRGIGMSSYELRDYPAAMSALEAALESARRRLTDDQRQQVGVLLERTRTFVGRFTVPASPEGSRIFVDGAGVELEGWPASESALLLGIGDHEVTIRSPEGRSVRARVIVRGREQERLDVDIAELDAPAVSAASPDDAMRSTAESLPLVPAPPSYQPHEEGSDPAPWIVAGVGAAALVTGAVLLGVGLHDTAVVENAERGTEWSTLAEHYGRAPALTASGAVLLGLGTAAAVGGIVWGSLADAERTRRRERLEMRVGLGRVELGGTF